MTRIGKNIMDRRKEIGMTQEELAQRMGYKSKSSINKIELGKSDIPQSKIKLFAEALGTTPGNLMGWEEVQKNNDTLVDIVDRLMDNPADAPLYERLLNDSDFRDLVNTLRELDAKQIAGVKLMLDSLLKH
ncbi:MAG: helix-turn-helix transcriptional regulator [Solibacillus sp.]